MGQCLSIKLTSNQISVANAGLKKSSYQRSVVVAWYAPEVVCESKDIFNDVFSWDQSRRVRWTSSLRRNICHATAVKPTAAQHSPARRQAERMADK